MNTGGPASEKTLLDEFAGQAMLAITISALSENTRTGYSIGNPRFLECLSIDAYAHAEAMLAEKARREATDKDSLTVQTREVDDDRWAKFQDGIIITFEPTMGWCASIREGSLGSGNTIAEAVANLRTMWEERSAAPVVQESSTTESYITDKNGIPVARVTHAPISDHSPDATKMIELQDAKRELLSALEIIHATLSASGTDLTGRSVHTLVGIASTVITKHKGAA